MSDSLTGPSGMLRSEDEFYEKIIRIISAMIRVSALGKREREMDTLCRNIVDIFSGELSFENCSIMLKDDGGKKLILVAGSGKGDKHNGGKWKTGTVMDAGTGIAGTAFATGKPIYVADVSTDDKYLKLDNNVSITSMLSVPIRAEDEIIGVINFSHPLYNEAYTSHMETLMVLLADFVGQVITLSRLYSSLAGWNTTLKAEVDKKTSELLRKNKQLRKIALIDPLTGIFNRRFFFKRLEEEFLKSKRYDVQFSLLFIDIDNLKPINDTYGHVMGDRVIRTLSRMLKQIGRKGDVACRLGGDEFGYMLLESDTEGAYNFAMRLQEKFARHYLGILKQVPTVSVGIANSKTARVRDHKELYRAADSALYSAKLIKNSVRIFNPNKNHNKQQLPLLD
ncbi:MAG TPA: sensor domain-containing diguanylate cyclase [Dissulfurispiraceae bacterium]|nr:sensor domain-containing diguanylate cyclase [Dissulfurispiraceae bacterium]